MIASEDLRALFDASGEGGLASWLAITQAALIALTLWAMVAAYGQAGIPRTHRAGWVILAVFFTYLAVDDGTRLHERIGTAYDESAASGVGVGAVFPSYYWQLLLGPFFAAAGLFTLAFLWRVCRAPGIRAAMVAAFVLLGFAVALDFIEGLNPTHPLNAFAFIASAWDLEPYAWALFGMSAYEAVLHFAMVLEEVVEMAAMTALWAVFVAHFAGTVADVRLRWLAGETDGPALDARSRVAASPSVAQTV